ncbi:MAG: C26 family cysteine hydrolase domain-containing family [Aeromonadales bacterium]|nr:C26 family cysteine hydrolase domain-containing family [Aeromonadales bacterium]
MNLRSTDALLPSSVNVPSSGKTLCNGKSPGNITKDSYLYDLLKTDKMMVNSIHHQAIKEPGENFSLQAVSADGIIESIKVKDRKFILGVQWYLEYNFKQNKYSQLLFKAFIDNCL